MVKYQNATNVASLGILFRGLRFVRDVLHAITDTYDSYCCILPLRRTRARQLPLHLIHL